MGRRYYLLSRRINVCSQMLFQNLERIVIIARMWKHEKKLVSNWQ